ncbi:MAG TPA: ribosome silencing factor [Gallionellaceae bacterium]
MLSLEDKTKAIVDALEDIKANDITVINTTKQSQLFDRMIIASGTSNRQTRALADNVIKKMQELGEEVFSSEGEKSGEWVLIDLGEILVHVMQPGVRAYYNLEELWGMHPPRPGK